VITKTHEWKTKNSFKEVGLMIFLNLKYGVMQGFGACFAS
jgi:hypothetical protein